MNIQYTDQDNTARGSVARMVVKRKCNITKVINKRCNSSHQGKVSIKRSKEEVAALPVRDKEQAFTVANSGWFTSDGKQYEPTGQIESKRSNIYLNKIKRLEAELKKKQHIIEVTKGVSSNLKNKVVEQEKMLVERDDENLNIVVNEMRSSTKDKAERKKTSQKRKSKDKVEKSNSATTKKVTKKQKSPAKANVSEVNKKSSENVRNFLVQCVHLCILHIGLSNFCAFKG